MPDSAEENTRWIEVWVLNDPNEAIYHGAVSLMQTTDEGDRGAALKKYCIEILTNAAPETSTWYTARKMTPDDYESVNWQEIAETLLDLD